MRGLLKGSTRDDVSSRRRARLRACTIWGIWGIWGWVQSRDWTSYLRGGFGPKSARSFGGDARSPVDCIKRRVPGRAEDASFFSVTEKKLRRQKNREHQRKRRIGATRVQRRAKAGERDGDARAPRAGCLSYHERRSAVGFERPLHVNGSLRTTWRDLMKKKKDVPIIITRRTRAPRLSLVSKPADRASGLTLS